jgi:hypothetical protein
MSSLIVNASNFAPTTQMVYGKPRVNTKGGKSINITNSATRRSLMIHTPMMLTYGVNEHKNDDGSTSYDMNIQFPREEFETDATRALKKMMMEMEEKIVQDAAINSRDWFGKKYGDEVVQAFWTPMLKYPKNKELMDGSLDKSREPTLKIKLPIWDGQPKFEVYDLKSNQIFPNEQGQTPDAVVQKGSNVCCTLMCGGIWITGSKFGVTWKLSQCAVKPPETFEKGKCYIPGLSAQDTTYGSDGEDEVPASAPSPVQATLASTDPVPEPVPEVKEEPIAEVVKEEPTVETVAEPVKKVSKKKAAASV